MVAVNHAASCFSRDEDMHITKKIKDYSRQMILMILKIYCTYVYRVIVQRKVGRI